MLISLDFVEELCGELALANSQTPTQLLACSPCLAVLGGLGLESLKVEIKVREITDYCCGQHKKK